MCTWKILSCAFVVEKLHNPVTVENEDEERKWQIVVLNTQGYF